MRLIDADALNNLMGVSANELFVKCWLDRMPTIDAVPVAQLREMRSNLERMCRGGDEGETYTTGYRNGHHNGQVELLRYILQVPDGTSEDEREDGEG